MHANHTAPASGSSRFQRWMAAAEWLRGYRVSDLRVDVVAGVTLAAYVLPVAIGDASLARLSPENGLYACICGGLVYWAFCSSRRTSITVTSAIALLLGTSLGGLANGDASRFGALAACTALLVALLAFAAWLVRAGTLIGFVSETVLIGFKAGVALTLASTQLPKLLGVSSTHGGFWECSRHFFVHLGETSPSSLAVGLAALAALVVGRMLVPNKPVALFVVAGGIVAAQWLGLGDRGVKLLGEVPQGSPTIGLPAVTWVDLNEVLPLAMACFMLAAVETAAVGRMFAAKYGGRLDADQEFLGLAAANLAAGLGQGLPVSGGMSQSLVNEEAGARSPASGLVAALVMLVVAVFLSGLLRTLPQPVLAAIVLMAVPGLVNVRALKHLWRTDRQELLIALVALAGVLTSGLLRGVLIGAAISLVLLVRRVARPHVAFLGRIPATRRFSDAERHPDNEVVPNMLIFRCESSLLYFNAEHVHDAVMNKVASSVPPPRIVLCDLSATPHVDLAGAEMLAGLASELAALGSHLRVVEARSSVRDRLRLEGLEEKIGRIDRFTSVADAVEGFEKHGPDGALPIAAR
ncbi:MAG: sulfate permease [Phycisphaerales bacterium]